jgi:Flp pilus assembly protein TadG
MPLFLAVVCGMIDYGWFFYQRYALAAAVRDGVRYGLTGLPDSTAGLPAAQTATPPADAWSMAKNRALTVLNLSNTIPTPSTNITFGGGYSSGVPTLALTLSATYTFVPLIGFVPLPSAPMHYSMTMLLESVQ